VLEGVNRVVPQSSLVEEGQVPDVEVGGPQGQGDERVREHAETPHRPHGKQRPQDRAGETGDDAERREVAEEQVLDHVKRERLQGQLLERPSERDDEQDDSEPEEDRLPGGQRRTAAAQAPHAECVEKRTDRDRQQLERVGQESGRKQ
jgi:hypothetical protein